jgi:hypothetical protein
MEIVMIRLNFLIVKIYEFPPDSSAKAAQQTNKFSPLQEKLSFLISPRLRLGFYSASFSSECLFNVWNFIGFNSSRILNCNECVVGVTKPITGVKCPLRFEESPLDFQCHGSCHSRCSWCDLQWQLTSLKSRKKFKVCERLSVVTWIFVAQKKQHFYYLHEHFFFHNWNSAWGNREKKFSCENSSQIEF